MSDELNPNNPVVRAARGHWHKIAALIMHKTGVDHIEILPVDVDAMNARGVDITISDSNERITVRLVTHEEGRRLAAEFPGVVEL